MELPFLSIIIPTLNEEAYLELTLNSILDQNYNGKYEIIVADGMSTDKTVKIAKKYTKNVIRVKRRGIGAGRNAGALKARGDVLVFMDADSLLLPNALTELVKPFGNQNVVGVTCSILPSSNKLEDFIIYRLLNELVKFSIKMKKAHVSGVCIACTNDAFKRIGGFNENLSTAEDTDFSIRLNNLGKIEYVDKATIMTSVRRLEKLGRMKTIRKYSNDYLSFILNKNSLNSKKFRPVR